MFLDDAIDDVVDVFEAPVKAVLDAAEGAVNAAQSVGDFVYDAIQRGIEAVLELKDEVIEALDDATKALVNAAKSLAKAADDIVKAADDILKKVGDGLDAIRKAAEGVILDIADVIAGAYDWVENNLPDPVDWVLNDVLPAIWGGLKLLAAVCALVVTWPLVVAATFICNLVTESYGHEYGKVVEAILRGDRRYREMYRIKRLPARRNYVIVSDIHRWAGADEQDAGFKNDSRSLYDRVLEHYGIEQWSLIENGDVEDYWLRGGGAYGVAYDMASYLPAPVLDSKFLDSGLIAAAQVHLARVVRTHKTTYTRLRALFHGANGELGRYHRTAGNHDDINITPQMQKGLQQVFPGLQVNDYIVLEEANGRGVALIAHGHQTDAWNQGACAFLGRITTSIASAIRDLPFAPENLGVPDPKFTDKLWRSVLENQTSLANDTLDQISPFGADTDLGSLDEVTLFEAFRKIWGGALGDVAGPWVLLGHTHTPLWKPSDPESKGVWQRYVNSGCCIFNRMVTAIEWAFAEGMAEPEVRLVGWRWHRDVDAAAPERGLIARRFVGYGRSRWLGSTGADFTFNHAIPPGV